jgi:hypothetical protein
MRAQPAREPIWLKKSRLIGFARWVSSAAVLLLGLCWAETASAYPWMIRHGYGGCLTCHTDPSGGELLAPYGRVQGDLLLRMRYGKDELAGDHGSEGRGDIDSFDSFDDTSGDSTEPNSAEPADADGKSGATADDEDAPESGDAAGQKEAGRAGIAFKAAAAAEDAGPSGGFLWGLVDLPEWLVLGGAYRHLNVIQPGEDDPFSTFPMQIDLYGQLQFGPVRAGGSIGLAKVEPGSPHARKAQITTNQGDELNLISRTHWVGAQFGRTGEFMVRGGRLNLPFGIRIPEHTMWVREATRTDRESDQQHGLAFAYSGENFRGEAMAIAGNYQLNPDRFRERGYSFYFEGLLSNYIAVGVSSLLTHADADIATLREVSTNREAHGAFARVTIVPPVVVLAEFDVLLKTDAETGYVGMVQADWELVQGLHLMLTGEILDQGASTVQPVTAAPASPTTVKGAGEPRLGGWLTVDWFFLPQLEARVDAVFRQEDPFTILGQLHVYL